MHRALTWLAVATLLSASPAAATGIQATATPFTGDDARVLLTFDDAAGEPGTIRVTVDVDGDVAIGDLRGVFLNLSDDSLLSGLSVVGPLVSDVDLSGDVIDLGQGSNLRGGGSPCPCDLGVELGSPGAGRDDIQSTFFDISHASIGLALGLFEGQLAGVRVTSVGLALEGREGSAKLATTVPEPGIVPLLLAALGLVGLGAAGRHS